MQIDQNAFFRQSSLRICGNLKIEQSLCECIRYLEEFMPANQLSVHVYDRRLDAMRTIAMATVEKGERTDYITPFPLELRQRSPQRNISPIRISNRPQEHPIDHHMGEFFKKCSNDVSESSLLLMFLKTKQEQVGYLSLRAEGNDRYDEDHLRLFALLKEPFTIALANALKHEEIISLHQLLEDDNRYLSRELQRPYGSEIVGAEFGLREVMKLVRQVATKQSPVLLLGETGVGKDVIANATHKLSPRSDGPFIKFNCGAIPDTLVDSELFGHEKGAFTGATEQKRGRFERAHNGTIFLDEIAELPLSAQVRMLHVIQNKEIERVGGTRPIPLNIRIIAATHRNLEEMVQKQHFRQDLWFRLNVFPIHIPPLRERKMDIAALVAQLIKKKSRELCLTTVLEPTSGTVDRLAAYHWPGNVRELENIIERALILSEDGRLDLDPLVPLLEISPTNTISAQPTSLKLNDVISTHIERVLEMTEGKVHGPDGAAKLLDINTGTLRNKMKKLGIAYGRKWKSASGAREVDVSV